MFVKNMNNAVMKRRNTFREILEKQLENVAIHTKNGTEIMCFKEWIIRCFDDCHSEFEEQTMIENLREEFEDYLKGSKSE